MTAAVNPFVRLLSLVPNRPVSNHGANQAAKRAAPARDELFARAAFSPGWDDCFVNAAVKAAILRETSLAHAGIHVSTSRGVVQLSGFVETRAVMARAVTLARAVDGVKAVRNDMRRR